MEDLIAAEHGGYHVGLTMDRRTSAEAAALHGVHLDLLERARAAAGRLPL
jgi:hypothetical protein